MKIIGKYTLEAEIGRGGFGRVYRAFDPTVGRTVAIKILIADKDKDLITRFKREATATGKLRHSNIVTVYDYGEQDGSPYIVMEYLEGRDLNQTLASHKVMTLLEKTSIMSQVAEGLQHAHHHGIVHRDVKPANIMILTDGTIKIMDFGIARVLREDTTRLTQMGNLLGTLSYMSPEVFRGTDVSHLCDIFSYGVIYYELISGKHPFAATDSARVIYNVTSVQPPLLNTIIPDCPPGLAQIVARAMHKDRELRYQSLEDLLFDLMPIRMQLQSAEAQGLIQKAETLISTGQIGEAQTVIRQVMQLDPNNTVVRNLRDRINREAQLQVSRERCSQLIASAKEQLASLQYPKAMETLEAADRLDPENPQVQSLLEQARLAIRKKERAESLIAQARRELQTEQITDAYRSILECFQYAPEHEEANELLRTIRAAIERRERQRRFDDSVARIEELVAAAKLEEAEVRLSDLEVSYPASERVKQLLAEVRAGIKEEDRRRRLAESLDPIRKMVSRGNWRNALVSLEKLATEFPGEEEILSLSAQVQAQLQAQLKAEHLQQLLDSARTANEARDFERALDLIRAGLRSYPGEAALEAILRSTEELRREYQREIAIRSATERANGFMASNKFPEALAEVDQALSTFDSGELRELRLHIESNRAQFERARAIASACASVKGLIDKGQFEAAISEGQQALVRFPDESSLDALIRNADALLAEQRRKARIDSIRDRAAASAAKNLFSEALEFLRNGIIELPGEPLLISLQDRIQADQAEHERRQLIAAWVLKLQKLIQKNKYAEAIREGSLALVEFPGEASLSALVKSAERALSEEQRAAQIAAAQQDANALASAGDFAGALRLLQNTIRELGAVSVLQDLANAIDGKRRAHEKKDAIQSAVARAKELLETGEYSQIITLLQEKLAAYPGEAEMESLLAQARSRLAEEQRSQAIDAIVIKTRKLVETGDFKSALNLMRSSTKTFPDDARLTSLAAEIKTAMVELETERAIRAALESAAAMQAHGQFGNAAQILEQALLKAPGRTDVREELARIQEKLGKQKEVNAALDKVCELMSGEKFAEALESVQNAMIAFPGELAFTSLLEEVRKSQQSHLVAEDCRKVEALRVSGDLEGARHKVVELSGKFPGEPGVTALKSRIEAEISEQQKRQESTVLITEIRSLLDKENVEEAIVKLEAAVREHPNETEITALHAYTNEIIAARKRADAVSDLIRQSKALLEKGKPRDAQRLLKDGVSRYSGEDSLLALLKRANDEIDALDKADKASQARDKVLAQARSEVEKKKLDAATKTLEKGLVLYPNDVEIRAELDQLREKANAATQMFSLDPVLPQPVEPIVEAPVKSAAPASVSSPVMSPLIRKAAVALVGLVVVALLVWALLPKGASYDQQLATARSFLDRKEFGKAIEALEAIPSGSPLYKQAQDLLTSAKNGQKQNEIDALLAEASGLYSAGKSADALVIANKVLEKDPDNTKAALLRDEIKYRSLDEEGRRHTVDENLNSAETQFNSGELEKAVNTIDGVIALVPNDQRARSLKEKISSRQVAVNNVKSSRKEMETSRSNAEAASAQELSPERFQAGEKAEKAARLLQNAKPWDPAAKAKFDEAAKSFDGATSDARVEQTKRTQNTLVQLQKTQAETAQRGYEQNFAKAKSAEADTRANATYQVAMNTAADASTKFGRGDYIGARDGFGNASQKMQLAAEEAAKAQSAAPPPPPPPGPTSVDPALITAMNIARNGMEVAKRVTPAGDTGRAAAEDSRARQLEQDGKPADAASAYRNAAALYKDATALQIKLDIVESEKQAIRTQLERYRTAYEKKNLAVVKTVYKDLPAGEEKILKDSSITSFQIELVPGDIQIMGDAAIATYKRTMVVKVVRSQGKDSEPVSQQVVFNLRKEKGSWIIQSMVTKK